MPHARSLPRLVTAGLKGGSGKTLITVGIAAAFRKRGLEVAVYKKGPDYIDAGWLGSAVGKPCRNLDSYLFAEDKLLGSFLQASYGTDLALVEGNRGLFDGVDTAGSFSTAELAKTLSAPVILIVDVTKTTRTAAAMVLGSVLMDPEVHIAGVILNRTGGARHYRVLRESIEDATGVPIVGSIPKLTSGLFPQRHLGLLPLQEHPEARALIENAAETAENFVDLDALLVLAEKAAPFTRTTCSGPVSCTSQYSGIKIGIIQDCAFQFYYPENLEALKLNGARLVSISAVEASELPDIDALYIGGGFPETNAELLAGNASFRHSVLKAAAAGLPIYAECGGLMYLSRSLIIDGRSYPMAGVFPVDTLLERSPQGLGYIEVEVEEENPFYPKGMAFKGHEFHYSTIRGLKEAGLTQAFKVHRGVGMGGRDGLVRWNTLGTYVHVHALGEPAWARGMLERARVFSQVVKKPVLVSAGQSNSR